MVDEICPEMDGAVVAFDLWKKQFIGMDVPANGKKLHRLRHPLLAFPFNGIRQPRRWQTPWPSCSATSCAPVAHRGDLARS